MNLRISKSIEEIEINNYANNTIKIDCSDGINPFGCSDIVLESLSNINKIDISNYFHNNDLKEELSKYWNIKQQNIVLCNGSIQGLQLITILFKTPNAKLLSFVPNFPDFSNYAKLLGYKHKKVELQRRNNYKCDIDELIRNIDDEVNLIYIDNPNNPTGQVIEKESIIKVLKIAEKYGIGVVIDEAFGDFLPKNMSCIELVKDFPNLIVVKTFSKGFGLAGIRAGYIVSNEEITSLLEKISNPYSISGIAQKLSCEALKDSTFLENIHTKIEENKKKLIEVLPNNLKIAETDLNIPICLLYTNHNADLSQKFSEKGVKVYSGKSFEGLGKDSIRLNLPNIENMDSLLSIISNINLEEKIDG